MQAQLIKAMNGWLLIITSETKHDGEDPLVTTWVFGTHRAALSYLSQHIEKFVETPPAVVPQTTSSGQ